MTELIWGFIKFNVGGGMHCYYSCVLVAGGKLFAPAKGKPLPTTQGSYRITPSLDR
jgi:hypothetical protein